MPNETGAKAPKAVTLVERIADGKSIYAKTCFACHQATGEGLPNAFPPLAKSDYLNADVNRAIEIVLKGKTGEVVVNGKKFNSVMTAQTPVSYTHLDVYKRQPKDSSSRVVCSNM